MKIKKGVEASDYDLVKGEITLALNAMPNGVFDADDLRKKSNKKAKEWPNSFVHQAAIDLGLSVEN